MHLLLAVAALLCGGSPGGSLRGSHGTPPALGPAPLARQYPPSPPPGYSVTMSEHVPGLAERPLHKVGVGVVMPHSTFRARQYRAKVASTLASLARTKPGAPPPNITHDIVATVVTVNHRPSPTTILRHLCEDFLKRNVSAILFLSNSETYGRETASLQYLMQLADYLRIPLIAWNADNSALERRSAQSGLQLQLAPTLEHQTAALLTVLQRYKWHQFSVVTSHIAGHADFIQAVREAVLRAQPSFKVALLQALVVSPLHPEPDLAPLVTSETRIVLLYCTRDEARSILKAAANLKLNGTDYLWLATQSVISSAMEAPGEFPVGMLGVHFPTNAEELLVQLSRALRVFASAVDLFAREAELPPVDRPAPPGYRHPLLPRLSCGAEGARGAPGPRGARWDGGQHFYRFIRMAKVDVEAGGATLEFKADGTLKATQLQVMNLQPQRKQDGHPMWTQIGVWKSWEGAPSSLPSGLGGLDVRDVVWPGSSHTPPQGVPEKFHLRIAFLEEPPYVHLALLDPVTKKCPMNKGVHCRVGREDNPEARRCCSGFCIDLLHKFAEDLGFTFDLFRVEDGKWGAQTNGSWNGLVAALISHHADLVMTSLKINYERSQAIDFSLPFLDTGIAIVVAKRTGIISPTAFLEPFDSDMWMLVALGAVHVAALAIFMFEWLSPSGYDKELGAPRGHRFSLCRTLWLVWAVLFQAAVNLDCPRGYTARCMANVWAMFALIFLAIYTANLAAFMITREEFHELSGINDTKLSNPFSLKPPFRFGTIPHGNTDAVLRRTFPRMHAYMRAHNRSSVLQGVQAVKEGMLDAFLYDATVLDYLAGQDPDCVLLTVGSWFAMTGYGVGFPRRSKYRPVINRLLMEYRENGDLERLRRYWFTGSCNNPAGKEKQSRSDPLALEQFFSTFLLLFIGMLLSMFLLGLEHLYFKYALRRQNLLNSGSPHHQLHLQVRPGDRREAQRGQVDRLNQWQQLNNGSPHHQLQPNSGSPHHQLHLQVRPEERREAQRGQVDRLNQRLNQQLNQRLNQQPDQQLNQPKPKAKRNIVASCCSLCSTSLGRTLMGELPLRTRERAAAPGAGVRARPAIGRPAIGRPARHDPERCAAAHRALLQSLADQRARAEELERVLANSRATRVATISQPAQPAQPADAQYFARSPRDRAYPYGRPAPRLAPRPARGSLASALLYRPSTAPPRVHPEFETVL